MNQRFKYPMIAITGGPSGGKSSGMARVRTRLMEKGVTAFTPPETATLFFTNGVNPRNFQPGVSGLDMQRIFLRFQLAQEGLWQEMLGLDKGRIKVLICDRGAPDSQAYVGEDQFLAMLKGEGLSMKDVREERYIAAVHMVTAADGAEEFYSLENLARTETPAEARALDLRTQAAWIGHDHFHVIGNRSPHDNRLYTFNEKLDNLVRAVFHALGIPEPIEVEAKFWVRKPFDYRELPVPYVNRTYIEQDYLRSTPTVERRVRKMAPMYSSGAKSELGPSLYVHTEKISIVGKTHSRYERETIISKDEYSDYLRDRSPEHPRTIRKIRNSFVFKDQYFQVDEFLNVNMDAQPLVLAEVEFTSEEQFRLGVVLPDFLGPVEDVTARTRFKNAYLAKSA